MGLVAQSLLLFPLVTPFPYTLATVSEGLLPAIWYKDILPPGHSQLGQGPAPIQAGPADSLSREFEIGTKRPSFRLAAFLSKGR